MCIVRPLPFTLASHTAKAPSHATTSLKPLGALQCGQNMVNVLSRMGMKAVCTTLVPSISVSVLSNLCPLGIQLDYSWHMYVLLETITGIEKKWIYPSPQNFLLFPLIPFSCPFPHPQSNNWFTFCCYQLVCNFLEIYINGDQTVCTLLF